MGSPIGFVLQGLVLKHTSIWLGLKARFGNVKNDCRRQGRPVEIERNSRLLVT